MKKMIRRRPHEKAEAPKHSPYRIDIDPAAGTVYITLRNAREIKKTCEFSDELNIDLDSKNNIVGIEILRGAP